MNILVKSVALAPFNLLYSLSPETCLKALFRIKQGYRLNLDDPQTFSEKIQWIKLHDRNPLMPRCADKWAVRSYVEERGYGEYLNELLWHGSDPAQIPFSKLPERYVVKVTHGSTFNFINDGSESVNQKDVVARCRRWLHTDFLPCYGEWFYGRFDGVEPSIIVERYLEPAETNNLNDYKVFVMNGRARLVLVCTGRTARFHFEDMFDTSWKRIEGASMGSPNSDSFIAQPACLTEMLNAAEKLAEPFTHARVDFYLAGKGPSQRPVFGEITFTSGSGFDRFSPRPFDYEVGAMLELPRDGMEIGR